MYFARRLKITNTQNLVNIVLTDRVSLRNASRHIPLQIPIIGSELKLFGNLRHSYFVYSNSNPSFLLEDVDYTTEAKDAYSDLHDSLVFPGEQEIRDALIHSLKSIRAYVGENFFNFSLNRELENLENGFRIRTNRFYDGVIFLPKAIDFKKEVVDEENNLYVYLPDIPNDSKLLAHSSFPFSTKGKIFETLKRRPEHYVSDGFLQYLKVMQKNEGTPVLPKALKNYTQFHSANTENSKFINYEINKPQSVLLLPFDDSFGVSFRRTQEPIYAPSLDDGIYIIQRWEPLELPDTYPPGTTEREKWVDSNLIFRQPKKPSILVQNPAAELSFGVSNSSDAYFDTTTGNFVPAPNPDTIPLTRTSSRTVNCNILELNTPIEVNTFSGSNQNSFNPGQESWIAPEGPTVRKRFAEGVNFTVVKIETVGFYTRNQVHRRFETGGLFLSNRGYIGYETLPTYESHYQNNTYIFYINGLFFSTLTDTYQDFQLNVYLAHTANGYYNNEYTLLNSVIANREPYSESEIIQNFQDMLTEGSAFTFPSGSGTYYFPTRGITPGAFVPNYRKPVYSEEDIYYQYPIGYEGPQYALATGDADNNPIPVLTIQDFFYPATKQTYPKVL